MKPTLYDGIVISEKHVAMYVIDNEETLILEEESRSKMSEKAKDPEVIAKKNSHKPIDYEKLNRLTDDFGKHFTLQQELSAEQAFCNDEEGSERENDSVEHESDFKQETDGSESDSESDQQDDDEVKDDDDEVKDDDEDDENDDDKSEGNEDRGMDNNDVQDKKAAVNITDAQQEKENLEITQEKVVKDAHVTITKKTEVLVTSSSRSSHLASKFLIFSDIPPADAKIVSPLDVHVHHEVPRIYTSTLLYVPISVIPEASHVYTNIP
nr:hypothetical protein [Tanacetum cinerariifolium]